MYKTQKLHHFQQIDARPTTLFEASKLQAQFRLRVHIHFVLMSLPSKVFEHRISEYRKNKRQNKSRISRNKDLTFAPVPDARAYTGSTGIDEFFRGSERLHLASSPQAKGLEDEVASCNVKRMEWWIDLNFWLLHRVFSRKMWKIATVSVPWIQTTQACLWNF